MSFHLNLNKDRVAAAHPDAPLAVATSATVGEVIQLMRAQKGGAALIVAAPSGGGPGTETVNGIFTERDALKWLASGKSLDTPIVDAMTRQPCMVNETATVGAAIELMAEGGYRHLPIVQADNVPTGVASVRGIVQYLVDHFPQTIYTLPPEPGRSPAHREGA